MDSALKRGCLPYPFRFAKALLDPMPAHHVFVHVEMHRQGRIPDRAAELHSELFHKMDHFRAAAQGENMPSSLLRSLPGGRIEFSAKSSAPECGQDIEHGDIGPAKEQILAEADAGKLSLHLR